MTYLMLFILIAGYFQLMVYTFIVSVLLYLIVSRCRNRAAKQIGSVKVLRSLTRTKFNYQLFRSEEECIICWNKYSD